MRNRVRLKRKGRGHSILIPVQHHRKRCPIAGHSLVVEQQKRACRTNRDKRNRCGFQKRNRALRAFAAQHEKPEHRDKYQTELKRSCQQLHSKSNAEDHCITERACSGQARQRPEDQAASGSRKGAAPIAVHPVTERSKFDGGEQSAYQRPSRRGPAAEHPITRGNERRFGHEHTGPQMTEDHPSGR